MSVTRKTYPRRPPLTAIALGSVVALLLGCTPAPGPASPASDPDRSGGKPGLGDNAAGSGGKGGATPSGTGGRDAGENGGATGGATPDPGSGGTATADAATDVDDPGTGDADSPGPSDGGGPAVVVPDGPRITDGLTQLLVTRAIGLGYYHACHLLASQSIQCYGTPPTEPRLMPPAIKSDQIFCSHNGCCVLTDGPKATAPAPLPAGAEALMIRAKRLACWGHKNTFFPPANLDMNPIQFAIGYDHGCALNADHSVVCWGQPGTMFAPPPGLSAKSITVASFFNCAVKLDDSVVCWGVNPPQPPAGLKAKLVAAIFHSNPKLPAAPMGTRHACAIQLDDTVKCWGDNIDGTTDVPPDLGPVKDLAAATYNTCALKLDGTPVCWGTRRYNEIAERFHPMPSGLHLKGFRSKLAAYCGLQMDDTMACWGDESSTHLTIPPGTKFYSAP
jgi:hypothetical protein